MALIFPKYSFIQNGSNTSESCYADPALCLPTSSIGNIKFQVTVTIPFADIGQFLSSNINYFAVVPTDFDCGTYEFDWVDGGIAPAHPLHHLPIMTTLAPHAVFNGTGFDVTMWVSGNPSSIDYHSLSDVNNVMACPVGSCFKLVLVSDYYSGDLWPDDPYVEGLAKRWYYGCTICFNRIDTEECYTSVISYANSDDAFDFDYSSDMPSGYTNIIELPMYLRDPVLTSDTKVYTKSDGSTVKLYERDDEVYTLETDLMPYAWHKPLSIALGHDSLSITNPNINVFDPVNAATQFVKKDNYEIEYQKAPLSSFGKGSCKLMNANPIHLINNNCS